MMIYYFRKLFNLYPGEEKKALLFALLGFCWSFGVITGSKYSDALFLIHVGAEHLPTTYISISFLLVAFAILMIYLFGRHPSNKVFFWILCLTIGFMSFIGLCYQFEWGTKTLWLWYFYRIVTFSLISVCITCYWTFIDNYFHLQDAKRLYGLFSSMIFLGSSLTGFVMQSGLLEFQQVIIVILLFIILSLFSIKKIVNQSAPVHEELEPEKQDIKFKPLLKAIMSSNITLLILLGNFVMYLLAVFVEFNYMYAFDIRFDAGTTEVVGHETEATLTLFMGKCMAGVSIASLIIGLFLYGRFIRRFGIGNILLFTPLLLFTTFSGWKLSPALIFPILGFFFVEGSNYIIDDSNLTLLLNAVPTKFKDKIRVIAELLFEPAGMLLGGLLLSIPNVNTLTLGLFTSALLLIITLFQRKLYYKNIYKNLYDNAIHFEKPTSIWVKKMGKDSINQLINSFGDNENIYFITIFLIKINQQKMVPLLFKKASQFSTEGKFLFLKALNHFSETSPFIPYAKQWLEKEQEKNLVNELQFLLRTPLKKEEYQKLFKTDKIKAFKHMQIENIQDALSNLDHSNIEIAREAALAIERFSCPEIAHQLIIKVKEISDLKIRLSLLGAINKVNDPSIIKPLILISHHFRPIERRFTEKILMKFGTKANPLFLELTKEQKIPDRCRLLSGKMLGYHSLSILRKNLYEIISKEIERAHFYDYHYRNIDNLQCEVDLSFLKDSLLSSYYSVLDFIIQLLGVAGELEEVEILSQAIRSTNPKTRSRVIEALQKTCEHKIFRLLYPLLEEQQQVKGTPLSLQELLSTLSNSTSQLDQIIAAAIKHKTQHPDWKKALKKLQNNEEIILKHFADELLTQ